MKIYLKMLAAAALTTAATSCSNFLDVNTNPNSPVSSTPDAILAQALATTAAGYSGANAVTGVSFNTYGSLTAFYWGKSGVVNAYTEERTTTYTTSYYQGLWTGTYDNLNDYNIIQTQGAASGYPNHAAIARIMKVYNYLLLVDEYGDIPYSQALMGTANVTPAYDKAADIYKDLLVQLTGAIADINTANAIAGVRTVGAEDIVFGGNMMNWKRFANSLKLRILMRESQTADATLNASIATQMTALQNATDGFITADAVAQPGYAQSSGQQNPYYNRYGLTSAGSNATERSYVIPTAYIVSQYVGNNDPRVSQLYAIGLRGGVPQYVGSNLGEVSPPSFTGDPIASRFLLGGGLLKGYNQSTPLMLLSEVLFLKAEAETRGLFTGGDGSAATDYQNGILASFLYFYRSATAAPAAVPADPTTSTLAGASQYVTYMNANATNPLVNYTLATPSGALGKQSVILYQKYLAMNTVASIEAWDDYRRAAQPKFPTNNVESVSPRPDKLATRLLYPLAETNTNAANIPTGITQYTKIFWDVVD